MTAGLTHQLLIIGTPTGKILQQVSLPSDQAQEAAPVSPAVLAPDGKAKLSFTGLVFSPDGTRIYLANVNGDIKVFDVARDKLVSPLFSFALPPANAPGRKAEIPAGIAVSRDGKKLYVALNLSNRLAELDAVTGKVLRQWECWRGPVRCGFGRQKNLCEQLGRPGPATNDLTGPAGLGTRVRVDPVHSIASEGSVSVIDLADNQQTEIITGLHTCALVLSPNGKHLVAANAGSDTLSVIDTRTDKIVETIFTRQRPGDPFGAQPDALAFDKSGNELFVCNGTQNAVGRGAISCPAIQNCSV